MNHVMKKTLAVLCLSATVLVSSFAGGNTIANAEETNLKTYGDFSYVDMGDYICINDYNGQEENVQIPETINQKKVTSVSIFTFKNSKLKSITLSKNIDSVLTAPTSKLENLEALHVVSDNPMYSEQDGVLYNKNGTELVFYPPNRPGSTFKIPDQVVRVDEMGYNKNIQTLIFSKNMEYGPNMEESNVEKVIVPKKSKLKYLFARTFFNCRKLTSMNLPNGVEVIASQAFEGCISLSDIRFPKTLQEIGDSAFEKCTSLKKVTIPKRVYFIGTAAFASTKAKLVKKSYLQKVKNSGRGHCYMKLARVKTGNKTKSYKLADIYRMKPAKKKISVKRNKNHKLETKLLAGSKWGVLKNDVVEYSTSNPKVATVSAKGVVKGKKKGTCTIRITLYKDEQIFTSKVKVRVG